MDQSLKPAKSKLEYCFYFLLIPLYAFLYTAVGHLAENRGLDYGRLLTLNLDHSVPFIPLLVIPYVLTFFYLYFAVFYLNSSIFFLRRTVWSILALALMLNLFYFLIPTYYPMRIDVGSLSSNSVLNKIMLYTYSWETSWNSFPSSHIAFPWLILRICMLEMPGSRLLISLKVFFVLVMLSVITIKVHFLLDILGGVIAAEFIYQFVYKILARNNQWVSKVQPIHMLYGYSGILIAVVLICVIDKI